MGRRMKRALMGIGSLLLALTLVLTLCLVLLDHSWKVSGISMEPTYHTGDLLLTRKPNNGVGQNTGKSGPDKAIEDGDVVIVGKPSYWNLNHDDKTGKILVKRVIGTPGDTISLETDGSLSRNGRPIDNRESSVDLKECRAATVRTITVPDGKIMVRGDNVNHSYDSRWAWCQGEDPLVDGNEVKGIVTHMIPLGSWINGLERKNE